jgi:HEAT repeat protein
VPSSVAPGGSGRSAGHELLINVTLSLAVFSLLIAGLEGTARLFEKPGTHPPAGKPWAPAGAKYFYFYTLKPHPPGWPRHEVNAEGLRDREHPVALPDDVWRVAILGDSVTEGFGLPADQAYPAVLQRELDAAGERVEVLSVAVRGWSTLQERIAYHRIARRYDPQQVLLGVCLNDIIELAIQRRPPPRLLLALHRRSAFVRWVVDATRREEKGVEQLFSGTPPLGLFFDEVSALRSEIAADRAELSLVVFPFRFQLQKDAPAPTVQAAISAWCASQRLRCLDMLPVLRPLGPSAFIDPSHLSREGTLASAEAIRPLLRRCSMPDALREELGRVGTKAAREAVGWLDQGGPGRGAGSAPPAAREALAAALHAPETRARAGAAWALGRLEPDPDLGPPLRQALADPSEAVAAEAARALGRGVADDEATAAALLEALGDGREVVRWAAADALDRLTPQPGWLGPLRSALGSRDEYVRNFAAWTLGRLAPDSRAAALELVRQVDESDDAAASSLARAARDLGPALDSALARPLDELAHGDARARARAARTLGLVGAKTAVPALTHALADPDAAVRARAVLALGRIGEAGPTIPALRATLRDPDPWVREESARALGNLATRDPALTADLVAALADATPGVRRQAARALGRVATPDPPVLAALRRSTADGDERVRREARTALDRLEGRAR